MIKLEDCTLITNAEYDALKDPIFKGQTRLDKDGWYYMVWESENKLYKTKNRITEIA